jgi:hypothetical protein
VVAGLLLVLAAVALGTRVVAAADDRTSVWSVRHDLAVGAIVGADDLVPVRVRLETAAPHYLSGSTAVTGLVVTRPLAAGELLPATAVAKSRPAQVRALTVEVSGGTAAGLTRHAVVDVYVVPHASGGGATPQTGHLEAVLRRVPVLRVGGDGRFGTGATTSVTLQVPADGVGAALAALAAGDVHLVEVPA